MACAREGWHKNQQQRCNQDKADPRPHDILHYSVMVSSAGGDDSSADTCYVTD
jgi:hypothetical protein